MPAVDKQYGIENVEQLRGLGRALDRKLPKYVFRAIAKGLYDEGKDWLDKFRAQELEQAFKARGSGKKIGNTFKVYVSGRTLSQLTLGIFTFWEPAEIYETGGTIRAQRGMLAVPVTPRAYTSAGRVKRSWRDANNPAKFDQSKFEGLRPIPVRAGTLLVRDVTASQTKRGRTSLRKPGKKGGNAVEPVFLLIKKTKRKPVLQFFDTMRANLGRSRELERDVGRALQALAGDVGKAR